MTRKSHPIFFIGNYLEAAEAATKAAHAAAEAAATKAAEVAAAHHHEVAAESAHAHLANLAALGECKESGINILGNEILCCLACG